ncbi:MAG: DUF3999 family protein [Betaproteobacteria bacterium]
MTRQRGFIQLLAVLCTAPVWAQPPDEFAARVRVTAERTAGLHVLQLNEDVYRAAASADLHDLRIFNAAGEALPLARLPVPPRGEPVLAAPVRVTLVALPSQRVERERTLADFALRIEQQGARATIELAPAVVPPAPVARVGGYLLDLRGERDRDGVLALRFAEQAADFSARIEILGSDDLVDWRPLASGPLVRNRQLGEAIERNDFALVRAPAFLRIDWHGAAPELEGATFAARVAAEAAPLPRARLAVVRTDTPGRYLVELPIALPIAALHLRAPRDNMALRVRLWRYEDRGLSPRPRIGLSPRQAPERWVPEGPPRDVYRLERDGRIVESSPFALSAPTSLLRIETIGAVGYGDDLPIVEAEWQPARYLFAARPPAPYTLAVGLAGAKPGPVLDPGAVLAADDPAGLRLPPARIEAAGAVPASAQDRGQRVAAQAGWSLYLLWVVLASAVALLAFMAWRIAAQLRAAEE